MVDSILHTILLYIMVDNENLPSLPAGGPGPHLYMFPYLFYVYLLTSSLCWPTITHSVCLFKMIYDKPEEREARNKCYGYTGRLSELALNKDDVVGEDETLGFCN